MVFWKQLDSSRVKPVTMGKHESIMINVKGLIVYPTHYLAEQMFIGNLIYTPVTMSSKRISDRLFTELIQKLEAELACRDNFNFNEWPLLLFYDIKWRKWYGMKDSNDWKNNQLSAKQTEDQKLVVLRYENLIQCRIHPDAGYNLDGYPSFHGSSFCTDEAQYHQEYSRLLRRYPIIIADQRFSKHAWDIYSD